MTKITPENIVKVLKKAVELKDIKRTGWVREGILEPESVAAHSYSTVLLSLLLARSEGLDEKTAVYTALIHDLGEADIGDIVIERGEHVHTDKVSKKKSIEKKALRQILSQIDQADFDKFAEEYENMKTAESQIVKEADKLDMVIQALHYETVIEDVEHLREFWINARKYLKTTTAVAIYDILRKESKLRARDPP